MSESSESLDDLMMGEVSETSSESDEKFSERMREAQAKISAVKKDEKTAHNFDEQLATVISSLTPMLLDFVIFLIDEEVPSLTILAILSLLVDEAGKVCFVEFEKHIEERANFSAANLPVKNETKISYWWTFIFAADHMSATVKIKDFQKNEDFVLRLSHNLGLMLQTYLKKETPAGFNSQALKDILKGYERQIFE